MSNPQVPEHLKKPETILDTAAKLVYGDRNKAYGHPYRNFSNIVKLQNAYLQIVETRQPIEGADPLINPNELTAIDSAIMNILQKIARLAENPTHMDSVVDIAGYAATIERIITGK